MIHAPCRQSRSDADGVLHILRRMTEVVPDVGIASVAEETTDGLTLLIHPGIVEGRISCSINFVRIYAGVQKQL